MVDAFCNLEIILNHCLKPIGTERSQLRPQELKQASL